MISAAMTIALFGTAARADVIAISPAAFPGGSTLITFTGIADGVEVNGLVLDVFQFTDDERFYSHRRERDAGRMATLVWLGASAAHARL